MIKNKTIKKLNFYDHEEIRIENWFGARRVVGISDYYILMTVTTCTQVQCDKCFKRLKEVKHFYKKGATRLVWLDLVFGYDENDHSRSEIWWDHNGKKEAYLLIKKDKHTDWKKCLFNLGIKFSYWHPDFKGGMHEYNPLEA